jgi:pSer/pThr/pTyr-binding forkhead associated (FHA) protein
MPREEDFAFWNAAKSRGYMTQDQIEESVEMLFALERVGSSKRAWDIARTKGFMSAQHVSACREGVVEPAAAAAAEPSPAPRIPSPDEFVLPRETPSEGVASAKPEPYIPVGIPKAKAVKEPREYEPPDGRGAVPAEAAQRETSAIGEPVATDQAAGQARPKPVKLIDLPPMPPAAVPPVVPREGAQQRADSPVPSSGVGKLRGFQIAYIESASEVRFYPITPRPFSIGSSALSDIIVKKSGVASRHARLTTSQGVVTVWDVGTETGVLVNHRRASSSPLQPNDLIQVGAACLVFLADYGDEPAPQNVSPPAVGGDPLAMLSVIDGPRTGTVFYVSDLPAVIGGSPYANVRIEDSRLAPLHAHLVPAGGGLCVTDLGSTSGVLVNNIPARTKVLRTGDRLTAGSVTFKLEMLREPRAGGEAAVVEAPVAAPAAPPKQQEGESAYEISIDAAVSEPESDATLRSMTVTTQAVVSPAVEQADEPSEGTVRAVQELAHEGEKTTEKFSPGDLVLTCLEGPAEGTVWVLDKPSTTIGRDRNADVSLRDLSVSRRHAAIIYTDHGIEARDLGSRNGIHVNGRRCRESPVNAGDTVRVGTCLFLLDKVQKGD